MWPVHNFVYVYTSLLILSSFSHICLLSNITNMIKRSNFCEKRFFSIMFMSFLCFTVLNLHIFVCNSIMCMSIEFTGKQPASVPLSYPGPLTDIIFDYASRMPLLQNKTIFPQYFNMVMNCFYVQHFGFCGVSRIKMYKICFK